MIKKSFAYGLEDVEGGHLNQLNLAIKKHNDSVRDAPLDPQNRESSIKHIDSDGRLPSEIRGINQPVDSFDQKPGVDNSLTEVLKVFKENERKSKKGNFGWSKAV